MRELEFDLVDIAPAPFFTGFEGAHDRVFGGVEMLGGMPVRRRITTANMAAFHAKAEMDPAIAGF